MSDCVQQKCRIRRRLICRLFNLPFLALVLASKLRSFLEAEAYTSKRLTGLFAAPALSQENNALSSQHRARVDEAHGSYPGSRLCAVYKAPVEQLRSINNRTVLSLLTSASQHHGHVAPTSPYPSSRSPPSHRQTSHHPRTLCPRLPSSAKRLGIPRSGESMVRTRRHDGRSNSPRCTWRPAIAASICLRPPPTTAR
ncbi:hypothetical protein C8Q80DRAFT_275884 [Daedaleopsis nitida]|nr:hypothetical protein C8Q80DRAFT_275884 [Daedaleopsis nitida]